MERGNSFYNEKKILRKTRACYDDPNIVSSYPDRRTIMSKGMDSKKPEKKQPAKTMKEKKADKKIKKAEKK
jgi:hypothetical protein